jgi:flagellar hook assembly protein FlgD
MVSISIYDLAGRRVATLQEGEMESGEHSVVWNGRSDNGDPVASGQYRYVMKTAEGQVSRSMILLK